MHSWAGNFGNEYFDRCDGRHIEARTDLLKNILSCIKKCDSFLEAGAGGGENLHIINQLTGAPVQGYDINATAIELMEKRGVPGFQHSITQPCQAKADFVLTWGTLCTLSEDNLTAAYESIYQSSNQYICICEYYAPKYEPIPYRGNFIYRGDHAGALMQKYPLDLIEYGFVYRNDPVHPLGDISWFLLQRK